METDVPQEKVLKNPGRKKIVLIIAVLVVVFIAIIFIGVYSKIVSQKYPKITTSVAIPPAAIAEKALAGKLIDGFLPDLIVAKDAIIDGSVRDVSKTGSNILITSYITKASLFELNKQYKSYFTKNKWTISRQASGDNLSITALSPVFDSVSINSFKNEKVDGFFVVVILTKQKQK
jgi:hypothetical protein